MLQAREITSTWLPDDVMSFPIALQSFGDFLLAETSH
jgi:hypothetical protein